MSTASDPKLRKAQERIRELRDQGFNGPFEVVDEEDAEGKPTGNVVVIDHGKRKRDQWVA